MDRRPLVSPIVLGRRMRRPETMIDLKYASHQMYQYEAWLEISTRGPTREISSRLTIPWPSLTVQPEDLTCDLWDDLLSPIALLILMVQYRQ